MPAMPMPPPSNRTIPPDARVTTWTAPDGWPLRRIDWPGRGRGRLLFQTGRGDFFEKYLEYLTHLHARGWAVTAFDWRGQGGSGRLSADPNIGHATDFGRYVADLAAFWRAWSAEGQGPRVAIGHSMGGHLVHRALVERAIDPQAAVLVAPMFGLKSPFGARLGELLARAIARLGDPARAAWKSNERPGSRLSRQSLLTHDAARYADEIAWHDAEPALRLGPPSWGWLAEAFASTASVAADLRLAMVATPILMLLADRDALVDSAAALRIAARMRDVETLRFGGESAHEILRESDSVRDVAIAAIDAFLDARAPA